MTDEPDPLQAQYDGIPVPCYTWRPDGDGFVLERANRAAHERFGGHLAALIGGGLHAVDPHPPPIAGDLATSMAERRTVRREMDRALASTGEIRRLDVSCRPHPGPAFPAGGGGPRRPGAGHPPPRGRGRW